LFEHVGRQAADAVKLFHGSRIPFPVRRDADSKVWLRRRGSLVTRPRALLDPGPQQPARIANYCLFAAAAAFSWRSRSAASSASAFLRSSSVRTFSGRGGGMSWTAG